MRRLNSLLIKAREAAGLYANHLRLALVDCSKEPCTAVLHLGSIERQGLEHKEYTDLTAALDDLSSLPGADDAVILIDDI